ncbi:GNAT family N-acetyltransferase [Marinicellulosiphila megalodicopiae]|uniref:GNAT family N-acetyltransferase n=1 Tax=Marinicellulosiphila megalodicopiae TaxID=2724896 RepID=UPI003BB0649D
MIIRNATLADLPYIYDLCAKTAFDGKDSRSLISDDNKVGHYFAAPYLHYDLAGCFVVCDNHLVKGYILGVVDTKHYTQWLNNNWIKQIQPLYDINATPVSGLDAYLNTVIHNATQLDERLDQYQAHFHIDLLPDFQNLGWGKQLFQAFRDYCKHNNVEKLHLKVSCTNLNALSFYEHLGFYEIFKTESIVAVGFDI